MTRLRWIILTTTLISLVSGFTLFLSNEKTPPLYSIQKLVRADIEETVLATGTLEPIRQVEVGAQVSGQLKKLYVTQGMHVKAGQLLAEIDPELADNDLKLAQADLDVLLAERRGTLAKQHRSQTELARHETLFSQGMSTQKAWQNAVADNEEKKAELAMLDARIARNRLEVEKRKKQLAYTRIVAPITGEVVKITTQEGQTIIAAQQVPNLLKLADLSRMTVRAHVPETDISRIKAGQKVYFTLLGDEKKTYHSVVRAIQPVPEKINEAKFFVVLFDIDNPKQHLRSDMTTQVNIVLAQALQSLVVPLSAFNTKVAANHYRLHIRLADGSAQERDVHIGIKNRTHAQVLAGLKENDEVIITTEDEHDKEAQKDVS